MSTEKRNALGKGLSALLNDSPNVNTNNKKTYANPSNPVSELDSLGSVNEIKISEIEVNPFQPRTEFDEQALADLSASIKLQGLIQPITVRKVSAHAYQLISGERRLRASKMAGLTQIPAYVRTANDQQMLEMALIENIQRENLNAIEVALSFQRMIDECSLKQEELGDRVSKNRSTVTNYLRLLKLPPTIQASIRDGGITMGHAKALLAVDDPTVQLYIFQQIIKNELSVRKVEEMVREIQKAPQKKEGKQPEALPYQLQKVQDDLASKFSTRVKLKVNAQGNGSIEIPFLSEDDLGRILEMLDW
ncbi:ParB/RepB/Spo0J family partition protein [Mucilaginibacter phyllosphaerae]|uniref:ParB family chromosome partitioning protein n=1 Tax=Mucilaginibacter phyllosphaerae TaxID=1812349 RepID=A0A4Y8AFE7_9SPHI|nr:ParB/RepB/Spo0J family partition protein [Mucilaginibacter phyllosphaerae]MBB3968873.1 ParB family chromosome partitioning protein [Mucilaginibacter phyllosphaerae]TEW67498.1 ParB/RepB/Spo0J family partition protein [Mucilaginibacter phyllosphaerae]GGH13394.1 chromosome partitioning protein ParB [Mucilaginibacter phyllosphaerae]